eukprot:CAMPEP_0198290498 /NCGR_PEP_ID=MMETSP1449-20131203/8341_1 /TAXON_ID=420275 /ORGANISM="Attheya septentrionalis, Strain CCMP2084" /LENGTH=435 /DNA_ID=CAMNT_0043989007 /DNA_START=155 /DNA_END=1462 /DNA_ORIENTATION=+
MPLESCMILLDNSEFMRNGDYIPTRLEAQHDAANMLVGQATQSNPETTVGVIAMSGRGSSVAGAELLVSPTDDVGKILTALHAVPIRDTTGVDICASVQVASLALKHRRNKNGAQRVILFVGSPLGSVEPRALAKAGRQLKKNNVTIDVICMGELEGNEPKLRELVDAANGASAEGAERTCHLVTIPAGVLPSDVLLSSPIVHGGGGGGGEGGDMAAAMAASSAEGGGGGGGGFADFGGIDPNMDPELAMALRVSMEEERARQERVAAAAAASAEEGKEEEKEGMDDGETAESATAAATTTTVTENGQVEMEVSDEEALLQQALAMSMNENNDTPAEQEVATADEEGVEVTAGSMDMDEDEDEAMQMALQMSMQPDAEVEEQPPQQFQDPQFVNQLLGSMPGVDPNDPAIQNALRNLNQGEDKKDEKKSEGKDGK